MKKWCLLAAAVALFVSTSPQAKAFDPALGYGYGFGYGSGLGQNLLIRSRLPTPPYFAIYPPVYYGERYQRPYGDSPFAALPQLQSNASYQPQLRATTTTILSNPYCTNCNSTVVPAQAQSPLASQTEPVGQSRWIENPYVSPESNIATR